MHYNFARPHKTLSKPYPTTPAMASGVADHICTLPGDRCGCRFVTEATVVLPNVGEPNQCREG
jgi:hypothetical protein